MKGNIRFKIIIIAIVIVISLFSIYPTIKWVSISKQRKEELNELYDQWDSELREDLEWMRLGKEEREELRKEREREGKRIPQKPSLWRSLKHRITRWWWSDDDQIVSLGLDLQGGVYIVLETEKGKRDQVLEKIRSRVDEFGVREPIILPQGKTRIIVQLPGAEDPEKAIKIITERAFMQWMLVDEVNLQKRQYSADKLLAIYNAAVEKLEKKYEGKKDEKGNPIRWTFEELDEELRDQIPLDRVLRIHKQEKTAAREKVEEPLLLISSPEEPQVLSGDELKRAEAQLDAYNRPEVAFTIKGAAATRRFARYTRLYSAESDKAIADDSMIRGVRGWRLAVLLDNEVITAPQIATEIVGGRGVITGLPTYEEAKYRALQLRTGSLPADIDIIDRKRLGPSLGIDSIQRGVRAALLGIALVIFFMAIYYLLAGLIADFALFLNMLILLGVMAMLRASLTLPGIAGIILTIGMAVDANVLIFERIREELRAAKKIKAAIESGYDKAFRTIMDANITTLITALVLYYFGTGPVKGFAVTLSIGILTSMFTALVLTRLILELMLRRRSFQNLRMLRFFEQPKIDFVNVRKIAIMGSILVIFIGFVSFGAKYNENFGIDFTGGTMLRLSFEKNVDIADLRAKLSNELGLKDFTLRYFGGEKEVMIRTKKEASGGLKDKIAGTMKDNEIVDSTSESVGPSFARTLLRQALIAIIIAIIGIIIYISWRFEFRFAIAAIVALIHDVFITVGFLSGFFILTRRELNLPIIAAILTIIGYSLNDTIVVFDRIREDLKIMKRLDFKTIINTSINQTLSRTILTSLTTLMVVVSLLVLGGQAINDFAFALFIGVFVGTYSSVFVASPILIMFQREKMA